MARRLQVLFAIALVGLLGLSIALDPRVPHYDSTYDDDASPTDIARWQRDMVGWQQSPSWQEFPAASAEFVGSYVFGRDHYRLDVQITGDRIQYISWGVDRQEDGGAWYAVGEGRRQADGEWFTTWSCLDLSRQVSNGGGAWLRFNGDRRRVHVRYYHDTLPFGETPIELGEAVMVDLKPRQETPAGGPPFIDVEFATRRLEGRVRTRYSTIDAAPEAPFVLWGRVVDESGEGIAGAPVKRRAAGRVEAHTDARGFFRIELEKVEALTLLTAGKLGYYNGITTLMQETAFRAIGPRAETQKTALATITLREVDRTDHRDYQWVSPEHTSPTRYTPEQHLSCGNCHRREYDDWRESRHAKMAVNPWTRAAFERIKLATGQGPDECTPCHSPSLASTLDRFELHGTTLLDASGVHLHGNHCDFCHKIEAVPRIEAAGVNGSLRLLRPDPNDTRVPGRIKRVFGPLPDVSYLFMGASYNPLFSKGVLCASCHEYESAGGHVQSTYSEWRASRFATPAEYKECQDCHMPRYQAGEMIMVPGANGVPRAVNQGGDLTGEEIKNNGVAIARFSTRFRPLNEAHKHSFVGSDDVAFVRTAVTMQAEAAPVQGGLRVTVTLSNVGAGHAVPTGHGLKRYLLTVHGRSEGQPLQPTEDLPADEIVGAAATATTGALIGRRFGESWGEPYWRGAQSQDTRLQAGESRTFTFDLPGADSAEVKLIFRRGSPALLREHGFTPEAAPVAGAPLDLVVHTWRTGGN